MKVPTAEPQVTQRVGTVPSAPRVNLNNPTAFGLNVAQANVDLAKDVSNLGAAVSGALQKKQKEENEAHDARVFNDFKNKVTDRLYSTENETKNINGQDFDMPHGLLHRKEWQSNGTSKEWAEFYEGLRDSTLKESRDPEAMFLQLEAINRTQSPKVGVREVTQSKIDRDNSYKTIVGRAISESYTAQTPKELGVLFDEAEKYQNKLDSDGLEATFNSMSDKAVSGALSRDGSGLTSKMLLQSMEQRISKEQYEKLDKSIDKKVKAIQKQKELKVQSEQYIASADLIDKIAKGEVNMLADEDHIKDQAVKGIIPLSVAKAIDKATYSTIEEYDEEGADLAFVDMAKRVLNDKDMKNKTKNLADMVERFGGKQGKGKRQLQLLSQVAMELGTQAEANEKRKDSLNVALNTVWSWADEAGIDNSADLTIAAMEMWSQGAEAEEIIESAKKFEINRQDASNDKNEKLDDMLSSSIQNTEDYGFDVVRAEKSVNQYLLKSGLEPKEASQISGEIFASSDPEKIAENFSTYLPQLRGALPKTQKEVEKRGLFQSILDFFDTEAGASEIPAEEPAEDATEESTLSQFQKFNIDNSQLSANEVLSKFKIDENGKPVDGGLVTVTSSSGYLGQESNQTGIEGLRRSTVNYVNSFVTKYEVPLTITGGTEGNVHNDDIRYSHVEGYKIDLRKKTNKSRSKEENKSIKQLNQIVESWPVIGKRPFDGAKGYKDPDNNVVFWDEGNHWDVEIRSNNQVPELSAADPSDVYSPPLDDRDRARAVVEYIYREKGENISPLQKANWAIRGQKGQAVTEALLFTLLTHGAYPVVEGITGAVEDTPELNTFNRVTKGILYPDKTKQIYERYVETENLPKWAKITADVSESILKYGLFGLAKNALKNQLTARSLARRIDVAADELATQAYGKPTVTGQDMTKVSGKEALKMRYKQAYVEKLKAIDAQSLKTGAAEFAEKQSMVGLVAEEVAAANQALGIRGSLSFRPIVGQQVSFQSGKDVVKGIVKELTKDTVKLATNNGIITGPLSNIISSVTNQKINVFRGDGNNVGAEGDFIKGGKSFTNSETLAETFGEVSNTEIDEDRMFSLMDETSAEVQAFEAMTPDEQVQWLDDHGYYGVVFDASAEDPNIADMEGELVEYRVVESLFNESNEAEAATVKAQEEAARNIDALDEDPIDLKQPENKIGKTAAKGKPDKKHKRNLEKEVKKKVSEQSEKIPDEQIKKIREDNLLGKETIDEIIARKRGIITDAEAVERASKMKGTIDDVLNIPKGTVPNKEQMTAISQIVQEQREINQRLVDLIENGGASSTRAERELIEAVSDGKELTESEALQQALEQSTIKLRKAEIVLFAAKSEAGRALQGTKQVVDAVDSRMRVAFSHLKRLPKLERQAMTEELATRNLDDNDEFVKFLDDISSADMFDKVAEWITASKLWNPTTHAVNFGSNAVRQIMDMGIMAVADPSLAQADIQGSLVGLAQGLKNALRALTDEGYAAQLSKYIEEGGTAPAIKGTFGKIVRTPFRLLGAGDEIFRGIAFQRSLYRQAAQMADNDPAQMEEILKKPTDEMLEKATDLAKKMTFQEDMGKIGRMINQARTPANFDKAIEKAGALLLKNFVLFLKTPMNLAKQAVDISPFGLAKNKEKLRKAKEEGDTDAVNRILGEAIVGTAMMVGVSALVMSNRISGGAPRKSADRDQFYRETPIPYAIKIGDTWHQYKRIDPVSTVIALTADAITLAREGELSGGAVMDLISQNLEDKTFLRGMNDLFKLLTGEPWERERVSEQMIVNNIIPSFVGHAARAVDPKLRSVDKNASFPDKVAQRTMSQLPFVSKVLPPRVNVLGTEIERANKGLNYFFNPIQSKIAEVDPITRELADLGYAIPLPSSYFSRKKVKYKLNSNEYYQYSKTTGEELAARILANMATRKYQNKDIDDRIKYIQKLRRDIQDDWKDAYIESKGGPSKKADRRQPTLKARKRK